MKVIPSRRIFDYTGEKFSIEEEGLGANPLRIRAMLAESVTKDWASILNAGATQTQTVTVNGAALGDFAMATMNIDLQKLIIRAYVSAANTVTVCLDNLSGGTLDLGSGTLAVMVIKR